MLFSRKKSSLPEQPDPECWVIIAAAGSSSRMNGLNKLMAEVGGLPVLARTIEATALCPLVSRIIIVAREEDIPEAARLGREFGLGKVGPVIRGGATRTDSIRRGLDQVGEEAELVALHDGARPFADSSIFERVIRLAQEFGAAAPAIKVKDTVVMAREGLSERNLPRERLLAVQTPQAFKKSLITKALQRAEKEGLVLTDECSALIHYGGQVRYCPGSEDNIKITTPRDLSLAELIAEEMEESNA